MMKPKETKKWLEELVNFEKIVSNEEVNGLGKIFSIIDDSEENVSSNDEVDEDLEADSQRLNEILGLPTDTYSLTIIKPNLPPCVKYGVRSGLTHMNMNKFSLFSRGLQGPAIAIVAYATTGLIKACNWNEAVINQIIEDGDIYYCESYKQHNTHDRRLLGVDDLNKSLHIQKTHQVHVNIEDAAYTGVFHSKNPTEMHLVKALELFFQKNNAGLLTSSHLNISIWREGKSFNIFDGQSRRDDNLLPDNSHGCAKLILLHDLSGVFFIILEKSNVTNEHFVLYPLSIGGISRTIEVVTNQPERFINKPQRRPSGYDIHGLRALIHGTFHIMHDSVPEIIRGHAHLILALVAIIYSRLIHANKWSTAIIDLIFNQAHIYFVDVVRVIEKKIDENFSLNINDIIGDVFLGVYAANVKIHPNIIPGESKIGNGKRTGKVKVTMNSGFIEFFQEHESAILEIKKIFYAVWKDGDKYYFFNPFACDREGFRVDSTDTELVEQYKCATSCVTMNSTIEEVIEIILENTGNTEKDPFILHGIQVLYVKTGSYSQGLPDTVIYREKKTNRRPLLPVSPSTSERLNKCEIEVDTIPKPRIHVDKRKAEASQYPELLKNIDDYMMKDNEFIMNNDKGTQQIVGYKILNPHRLILHGMKNCLDDNIDVAMRGQQGLSMALSAIAYSKLKPPSQWRNFDIDKVIDFGGEMHYNLINQQSGELTDEDDDDGDYESDEDEDDESEVDDDEIGESKYKNYIDVSTFPDQIKFADNIIKLKKKMSIAQGDADPLVNLGEALDQYFTKYEELILENKKLMYGIWKLNGCYFIFNPYGSDEKGWRLRNYPAAFVVTDTINELVDLFHGILEFNDRIFHFHFIHIESIEPRKYIATTLMEVPEREMGKYQTLFLPLTDDDLTALKIELKNEDEEVPREGEDNDKESEDAEVETEDEDDENVNELENVTNAEEKGGEKIDEIYVKEVKKLTLVDPLMEIEEKARLNAPSQLNLFLVTTSVNLVDEIVDPVAKEALEYERLKYSQPPPYVLPPKRVLAVLLDAKKASKSISSLVSCFSIDSKLAIKIDFPLNEMANSPTINNVNGQEISKMIKLPPKKYLYTRILPNGFTPLRAINEKFIHDEKVGKECDEESKRKNFKRPPGVYVMEEVLELLEGVRITPTILPLGPFIKTPLPKRKTKPCVERKKRRCKLTEGERDNEMLNKLVCNTDDVLLDLIFSKLKSNDEEKDDSELDSQIDNEEDEDEGETVQEEEEEENGEEKDEEEKSVDPNTDEISIDGIICNNSDGIKDIKFSSESVGFQEISKSTGALFASMKLENRNISEEHHYKSCYFAAILCILAKTKINVNKFSNSLLDELILLANKIHKRTASLGYKQQRYFNNIQLHGITFNIIMKENIYADPKKHESNALPNMLDEYLHNYSSGILIFDNASYAFWYANDEYYYLFDPYACDEMGGVDENGYACLLKFLHIHDLITKIEHKSGVDINKPYRIHTLLIAHIAQMKQRKKFKNKSKQFNEYISDKELYVEDEELFSDETKSIVQQKVSLIELSDWLQDENKIPYKFDMNLSGFTPLTNVNASVLEVTVIENDITRPILAPFKSIVEMPGKTSKSPEELPRHKPYDRKFNGRSILGVPLDLCIMGWSCIHEPTVWGVRTIRGIYDASQDLAYDSLLSAEDTTVSNMIDGVFNEFDIANYRFHVIFTPIHIGKLYSKVGWNLAMSVKKIFDTPIYTGAIISCGSAHIGIMKIHMNFYAWWGVVGTKNLRIVTSQVMEDFLKLIIQEIDELNEIEFKMRVITISYAKKLDPDCSDMMSLHEPTVATSLPQIYRKQGPIYDLKALFRSKKPNSIPVFIHGTVALQQYELVIEPRVKRCYFVALLSVMVKRDIMESLMPRMIDKVMQVAEDLYRQFNKPKYHSEHILRNVTVMKRIFDFRDVASPLYKFKEVISTGTDDFYTLVKNKLRQYFKKHSSGILHFTNCCYGFWYSQSTTYYYYLDPYQCNDRGKRVSKSGSGCLGIFSSLCQMVTSMIYNRAPNTTGFFIHNIHVESINAVPSKKFVEDPMWIYLDYFWSAYHAPINPHNRRKKKHNQLNDLEDQRFDSKKFNRPSWNNYTIEIPNLIYSIWGTLGAYDSRFGKRAGKNQAAICIAVLAMQHLCHPSKWSAAILDSAVICGDCYYTESVKSAARRGAKYSNLFNLQPCFKVFPHIWRIEYGERMCGMLYGGDKQTTLAATLKLALEQSSNILIKCGKITLAVVFANDGYYAADACWTGPPLFLRNHGALYVLRGRNLNALVYILIRMINTNQRLEFTVTPVQFNFKHETCIKPSERNRKMKKRILSDAVSSQSSDAMAPKPPVCGAIAVADNDIYLEYRKKVKVDIECGVFFENTSMPQPVRQLDEDITRNLMISTEWHKNIGEVTRSKHLQSSRVPSASELFYCCDDYPRTVDFLDNKSVPKSIKVLTKIDITPELPLK